MISVFTKYPDHRNSFPFFKILLLPNVMKRISICTVCMNRLSHLRETLPMNISHNKQYPHLEFIVLDYNSGDGMEKWAKANLMPYIESGLLKYYKTTEPVYFNLSHSKNMALKLGTGEILCMVDADNFAGEDYVKWVDSVYSDTDKQAIITTLRKDRIPYRDQGGKLCFHKRLFTSVSGFDESLIGYGIDDVDLVNRMAKAGGERVFLENKEFLKCIRHSSFERLRNFHLINNLEAAYLQVTDHMEVESRVLYLLSDKTFVEMRYDFDKAKEPDNVMTFSGWTTSRNGKREGSFSRRPGYMDLAYSNGFAIGYKVDAAGSIGAFVDGKPEHWKSVSRDEELFYDLVMAYGECINRLRYLENDKDTASVNPDGWGKGVVYLNFDTATPIRTDDL